MGKCLNAFFSETTNMIKAKLYMNVHWMVLYNLKVFCSDSLTLDPVEFVRIVVAILKMVTGRNFSMLGINSGHHYLPTYQILMISDNAEEAF
jgi:hypothetical protein